jgi:TolB-like protein/class 3 adenylate cyclase/Tfp pilus assembly protein PilF
MRVIAEVDPGFRRECEYFSAILGGEEPWVPEKPVERKLAAIFAADIAGYSRLMAQDEIGTLTRLKACRVIVDRLIAAHRGRIFNTAGDSVVADFASAVDAVQCAVAVQAAIAANNADREADRPMQWRIGIHVGDVMVDGANLLGDGVNIAARLEALAEPGAICVSAAAHGQIGNKLPLAFDDLGDQQVKNLAQAIRVYRVASASPHPNPPPHAGEGSAHSARVRAADPPALALPDKPSIAVLPFANMSGDPEQEYFVDGMVEEIITALSRIRWLFVIARNSTFTYKGRAVDVKEVGRELGVRYVLEGSVRKAGNRVRITGQLIDALTGTHLWADRFDGSLEDVFELQDQVAVSAVGVIEPALRAAEIRRSAGRPTHDLTAHDLYLRALSDWGSLERDRMLRALHLLGEAIARDPGYGPAIALAAHAHQQLAANGWSDNPESNRREAIELARRALQVAPDDPEVLDLAGFTLAYLGEDIEMAMGLIDRSLALNPGSAHAWLSSGLLRMFAGQADLAIEHFKTSARLNPRDRFGTSGTGLGAAHFFQRRFDEAAAILLASVQRAPGFAVTFRYLASCYAHMGRLDEAREIVARVRAITPLVVPSVSPYRNPEDRELLLSGLRLAMGETE